MAQPASSQREIHDSQIGDYATVDQSNHTYNVHLPLKPAWSAIHIIPYPRNEDLVSRPDLVEKLNVLLPQASHTYCSAALCGLGGSGKTQIALNYAYERRDKGNCSVFWVHAESEATFSQDYKTIAQAFGVNQQLKGEDLLAAVRDQIAAQPDWVLVLDNADDLQVFGVGQAPGQTKSFYQYVPRASVGTVLWTSRDARIAGTLVGPRRGIKVARMKSDEAEELLSMARDLETNEEELETAALLEELQWLPLAIMQAGAYMRRTSTSAKEYSSLLTQRRWDILKANEFDRHRRPNVPNNVLETWGISIDRLRQESETAYDLLHVLAYVANQNIPHEIITTILELCDIQPEQLDDEATKAVTRLKEFSFLGMQRMEDGGRSYEMHKLVQEAARYGLSLWKPSVFDKVPSKKEGQGYFSGIAVQVILDLFPVSEPETWKQCEKYVAHAVQIGDWADLNEKKAETSRLFNRVSRFFGDRGRWREKEVINKRELEFDRKTWGEKHPKTIISMANLASTYNAQGRYKEAEEIETQVLDYQRETLGKEHPETIISMANLASTYWAQGRYKEAEEIETQVLDLRREISGEKHPDTITSMANLASTYWAQGRYKEAEEIETQVLDLRREISGEKHPDTISSMANLASTYNRQGRYKEAEEIHAQVLDLQRETLGKEHPDTLRSMSNLACTWKQQGRRSDALALMEECLQYRRTILGPEHPNTVLSAKSLESWKSEDDTLESKKIHRQSEQEEGGSSQQTLPEDRTGTSLTTCNVQQQQQGSVELLPGRDQSWSPEGLVDHNTQTTMLVEPRGQQFIRMGGQNKTNSRLRRFFRRFQ
ncbi:P-loop containing nucleoside triphosphate hydrolase protein [Trichoderma compactum]